MPKWRVDRWRSVIDPDDLPKSRIVKAPVLNRRKKNKNKKTISVFINTHLNNEYTKDNYVDSIECILRLFYWWLLHTSFSFIWTRQITSWSFVSILAGRWRVYNGKLQEVHKRFKKEKKNVNRSKENEWNGFVGSVRVSWKELVCGFVHCASTYRQQNTFIIPFETFHKKTLKWHFRNNQ